MKIHKLSSHDVGATHTGLGLSQGLSPVASVLGDSWFLSKSRCSHPGRTQSAKAICLKCCHLPTESDKGICSPLTCISLPGVNSWQENRVPIMHVSYNQTVLSAQLLPCIVLSCNRVGVPVACSWSYSWSVRKKRTAAAIIKTLARYNMGCFRSAVPSPVEWHGILCLCSQEL